MNESLIQRIERLQKELAKMRDFQRNYLERRAARGTRTGTDEVMESHQETIGQTLDTLEAIKAETPGGREAGGTPYPTRRERLTIQAHADKGDTSAQGYLELLDKCIDVLEGSNGISLARGLLGERDDVYGQAIDDALAELMPVAFKLAGGMEGLTWYLQTLNEQQPADDEDKQADD